MVIITLKKLCSVNIIKWKVTWNPASVSVLSWRYPLLSSEMNTPVTVLPLQKHQNTSWTLLHFWSSGLSLPLSPPPFFFFFAFERKWGEDWILSVSDQSKIICDLYCIIFIVLGECAKLPRVYIWSSEIWIIDKRAVQERKYKQLEFRCF